MIRQVIRGTIVFIILKLIFDLIRYICVLYIFRECIAYAFVHDAIPPLEVVHTITYQNLAIGIVY